MVASSGEANRVGVSRVSGVFTVEDSGAPLSAGAGCTAAGTHRVRCASSADQVVLSLLDANDTAAVAGARCDCSGGTGDDVLRGGDFADLLRGGEGNDELRGGHGNDVLRGGPGADRMAGGDEQDTADFTDHAEAVTVTIDGTANDGNRADGYIDNVFTDVESVLGTARADTLTGSDPGATGAGGNDVLYGRGGNDLLAGRGARDKLVGEDGDDVLDGGDGSDDFFGGSGADTASYSSPTHAPDVSVTLDGARNDGNHADGPEGARDNVRSDVENVNGTTGDDHFVGDGGPNRYTSPGGFDDVNGAGGNDILVGGSVNGGDGDDTVSGSRSVNGGAGNDSVSGSGSVNGGDGDDLVSDRGGIRDVLSGGPGTDTLAYAGAGRTVSLDGIANDGASGENDNALADFENVISDGEATATDAANEMRVFVVYKECWYCEAALDVSLHGRGGNDTLRSDGGNDRLYGDAGDDLLNGGPSDYWGWCDCYTSGSDVLAGGDGNDTADYSAQPRRWVVHVSLDGVANDGVVGGFDLDQDNVMPDVENVIGGFDADILTGNASDNVLDGRDGDDTLNGAGGADRLIGGDGNDTLNAGAGPDLLFGRSGNDEFVTRDGEIDNVDCGLGLDYVEADGIDVVSSNCEQVFPT